MAKIRLNKPIKGYRFQSKATKAIYRLNLKGRYALFLSAHGWKESVTPNSWLIDNEGDYIVSYKE